jgi:hypothetical protein
MGKVSRKVRTRTTAHKKHRICNGDMRTQITVNPAIYPVGDAAARLRRILGVTAQSGYGQFAM